MSLYRALNLWAVLSGSICEQLDENPSRVRDGKSKVYECEIRLEQMPAQYCAANSLRVCLKHPLRLFIPMRQPVAIC